MIAKELLATHRIKRFFDDVSYLMHFPSKEEK